MYVMLYVFCDFEWQLDEVCSSCHWRLLRSRRSDEDPHALLCRTPINKELCLHMEALFDAYSFRYICVIHRSKKAKLVCGGELTEVEMLASSTT